MYEKVKEMAKKPYIRYASLAHEIDRHNKITPTLGHQWLPFKGQYFFPSLATCWSELMLPLMDYQVVLLGLLLIPANLQNLKKSSQKKLTQYYLPDLP